MKRLLVALVTALLLTPPADAAEGGCSWSKGRYYGKGACVKAARKFDRKAQAAIPSRSTQGQCRRRGRRWECFATSHYHTDPAWIARGGVRGSKVWVRVVRA
jgi:hypothetical protein